MLCCLCNDKPVFVLDRYRERGLCKDCIKKLPKDLDFESATPETMKTENLRIMAFSKEWNKEPTDMTCHTLGSLRFYPNCGVLRFCEKNIDMNIIRSVSFSVEPLKMIYGGVTGAVHATVRTSYPRITINSIVAVREFLFSTGDPTKKNMFAGLEYEIMHWNDQPVITPYKEALSIFMLKEPYTEEELTKRKRQLLKVFHPDAGGDTECAIKINHAYEVLLERCQS